MTNKLPVIGKRYRHKQYRQQECLVVYISKHRVAYEIVNSRSSNDINSYNKGVFWKYFEELPDQEPTTEESSTVDNDDLTTAYMAGLADAKIEARNKDNKVQEALEELKHKLDVSFDISKRNPLYYELYVKAQTLVNALENVSNSTPLEKHDKEDHIVDANKKVKSIWKPISELPEDGGDVYIKFESSGIIVQSIYHRNHYKGGLQDGKPAIEFIGSDTAYIEDLELDDTETFKYIMLTDFVNQQISLEERITKLENK